jgi:hypothetical protein
LDLHAPKRPTPLPRPSSADGQFARTERYATSVLPFIGPAITTRYGWHEMHQGEVKDGAVDVVRGVAGFLAEGKLLVVAAAVIPMASPVLHACGVLGAIGTLAGAPLDGGRDVVEGARQHHGETLLIGGVKLVGSGLGIAGALAASPALVIASAVVGLGAIAYQNRGAIREKLHQWGQAL